MKPPSRRKLFGAAAGLIAATIFKPPRLGLSQSRRKNLPDPPLPGDPQQRDKVATPADPKVPQQAARHQREENFRAGVEKLYGLTGELREDLKHATAADVLSVKMYKRLQEIEKLAKQLESAVKG
ncbi:MAG TPA: hypothetical protein VIM00_12385 [Candidatus Acidoferrum sp.]